MAKLELFLLGSTQVRLDGVNVEVRPRKALALLVYLAVTAERHARDALATLLWPESSQRNARKSLRSRLSELKTTLGDDWIEADRESVVLRDGYWSDVADFQDALTGRAEDAQILMKAADLYRDDFMAGFTLPDCPEFDDWQFFQAESLRRSFAGALEKLIHILGEQKDYETAIPYGRRWLGLDPMHEPAQRELMRLYAQSGQQASALRQYDQSRQTLENELGISPSQETKALYQDIQAGKFERKKRRPRPQHNLPVRTSTFVGRESEIDDIKQLLLGEPGCRLLNLVGSGGIGKTRLALATGAQLLDAFADGVFFVSLAPVSQTDDIVLAIAKALDFTFYGEEDPKTQLLGHLAQKKMLIIADNFEHLIPDGAQILSEILGQAPDITLLVTSRERLSLEEEWGYDVQGLPFPAELPAGHSGEALLEAYSSLELFLQRARRANARFTPSAEETVDIIRICRYVDGTPLGIELAAPWVQAMSCREIADEIERNLDFLTTSLRNIPERHRSLRVVFEQTWERLSLEEQAVLQQLSVFRGGCTREAAEQVTGATLPVLASLVNKALLHRNNLGRYELHELIRQFAESKLLGNPETAEQAQQSHQDYFVGFLEKRTAGVDGARQKETISEIRSDMENVRLAWRRAVANKDVEAIDRSVECLYIFYIYSSSHYEGQAAFQQAVSALTDMPGSPAETVTSQELSIQKGQENLVGFLLATQTYMLARLSGKQGVPEEVIARLLREKPGDKRREAIALSALSIGIRYQGRTDDAKRYAETGLSLAVETGTSYGRWWGLTGIAIPLAFSHPLKAKQLLTEALEVSQNSGDTTALAFSNQNLARTLVELGEYPQAVQHLDISLRIFTGLDNLQGLGYGYEDIGRLNIALGDYKRAIQDFHQSIEYLEETQSTLHVYHCQVWLANAYRLNGDYQESEETSRAMLAAFNAIADAYYSGYCLLYLGLLAQDQGEMAQAERWLKEALARWESAELGARMADAARCLGHLMVAMGKSRHIEAIGYFQQALEGAVEHQMAPLALDVFVGTAHLLADAGEMDRAVELLVLVERHEASTFETSARAIGLLGELQSQLPPGSTRLARDRSDLVVWDVASDFSADLRILEANLKSGLQKRRHNLPVHTTTFIGRDKEVADIKQLLLDEPGCRLLNLVGQGGVGKTRLALATAAQLLDAFPDGVFFISLAPVRETDDIVPTIAKALNFTFYGNEDPKMQLFGRLGRKAMLLVIDNFEHLLGDAHLLSEMMNHAPDVYLMVTSRERLNLEEEWGYDVQGLPFPAELPAGHSEEALFEEYGSLELFLQRARRAYARFSPSAEETAGIIRICRYVDGMPLAIELAAPWVRAMSCREIADEIRRSLDILSTSLQNIPERHRSLRVVFEQTWKRLSEEEQTVLQQLSVFRGGCTRKAAEQVTGATLPILSSLVDKALVRRSNAGRYELHELIRQFAENQLKTDLDAYYQAQKKHQDFYISFLANRAAGLKGAGQKQAISEIKADVDNVRLTWRRAVADRDAEAIDKTAECLFLYYLYSSGHYEAQVTFEQGVTAFANDSELLVDNGLSSGTATLDRQKNLVGFLLIGQGYFLSRTHDARAGQTLLESALKLLRQAEPRDQRKEGLAQMWLGWALYFQGRFIEAQEHAVLSQSLLSQVKDHQGEIWSLLLWANCTEEGHPLEAEQALDKARIVCQKAGEQYSLGYVFHNLSDVAITLGRYTKAKQYIDQAISISEALENTLGLGYALREKAKLAIAQGKYGQAIQVLQQAITYFEEVRTLVNINYCQLLLGTAYRLEGDYHQAEQLYRLSLQNSQAANDLKIEAFCLVGLGCLAYDRDDLPQAEQLQREALDIWRQLEQEARIADVSRHLGEVMMAYGKHRHAEANHIFRQSLELAKKHQLAPIALHVCVSAASLLAHANRMEQAMQLLVLAEQHEASTFETKERARRLLAKLDQAQQTGRLGKAQADSKVDVWEVATDLSAELRNLAASHTSGSPSGSQR